MYGRSAGVALKGMTDTDNDVNVIVTGPRLAAQPVSLHAIARPSSVFATTSVLKRPGNAFSSALKYRC